MKRYGRPKKSELRKHVKMEKRIVRAMYRAGLLDCLLKEGRKTVSPNEFFYWESFKRVHKSKNSFGVWLPGVYWCQTDYWGESDDIPVVDRFLPDCGCEIWGEDGYTPCNHHKQCHTNTGMLKYIRSLPIKRNDHAINLVINRMY